MQIHFQIKLPFSIRLFLAKREEDAMTKLVALPSFMVCYSHRFKKNRLRILSLFRYALVSERERKLRLSERAYKDRKNQLSALPSSHFFFFFDLRSAAAYGLSRMMNTHLAHIPIEKAFSFN